MLRKFQNKFANNMKKVLFITICLGLIATNLQSQTKFGLKFGPTISTFSWLIPPNLKNGVGASFNAGFYFDKYISKSVGINYGINYYGSKSATTFIAGGKKQVMIPVYFKFYIKKNFSIDLGPQFTYLIDNQKASRNYLHKLRPVIDIKPSLGFSINLTENIFLDSKYILSVTPLNSGGSFNRYFQSLNVNFGFTLFNKGNSNTRIENLLPTNN
jgi:hypothetical protein